jgi:cytochrome c oxidase cbb3-type subunit 4
MDMDLNTLRSLVTVMSFAVFLGIVAWAFSRGRRHGFDEAAALPFDGEPRHAFDNPRSDNLRGGRHE